MKNYKKGSILSLSKGFTLIELLVVIAIIGVLASVVLAATNSARIKGADAAVKANLGNLRSQAEIFYDSNSNTYTNICASGTAGSIYAGFVAGATAGGATTFQVNGASTTDATTAKCNNSATAWAVETPLKSSGFWCVDSAGATKANTTAGIAGATDYTC